MTNNIIQHIFSLVTGDTYTIEKDELKNMDKFQIPLSKKPSASCNKCYGRMHVGFSNKTKTYIPCPSCLRKCIDMEAIIKQRSEVETAQKH